MRSQWAGGRGLRWNLQQTLTPAFCASCVMHTRSPGVGVYRTGRPWAGHGPGLGAPPRSVTHTVTRSEQEDPLRFWGAEVPKS